jgi:exodeoxyribonuclease VII small subunit
MPSRRKAVPAAPVTDLSFEESIAELDKIVEAMEGEQLPLEELIARYETGSQLLKQCDSILTGARKRIELITLTNREAGKPQEPETEDSNDDNDITLF